MKSNIVTGSARLNGRGVAVVLNVPLENPGTGPPLPPLKGTATHAADFSQVNWFGTVYHFGTREQRAAIGHLWRAAEQGNESIDQAALLDVADCEYPRLRDVFRNHPAFGVVIVQDLAAGPGMYRLSRPV